jgi:RecA-family ATPase
VVEALVAELIARNVDVLVIDPFVSSHGVNENDNSAIDAVAKTWARIAKRANCAIVLVHHSRKLGARRCLPSPPVAVARSSPRRALRWC